MKKERKWLNLLKLSKNRYKRGHKLLQNEVENHVALKGGHFDYLRQKFENTHLTHDQLEVFGTNNNVRILTTYNEDEYMVFEYNSGKECFKECFLIYEK